MAKPVTFRSVVVNFGPAQPGNDVKLLVGNSDDAQRGEPQLDEDRRHRHGRQRQGNLPHHEFGEGPVPGDLVHQAAAEDRPGPLVSWRQVFNVVVRGIG